MGDFITRGHLGGYVSGGDPDTMYPELWAWLVEYFEIQSVFDVGCGDGAAIDAFTALGCEAEGVDGVRQEDERIYLHDYTVSPFTLPRRFDLIWSCEFVEHVEEQYVENFLRTFAMGRLVAMTHAVPGQAGHHHVNCQPTKYWEEKMASIGYYPLSSGIQAKARRLAHHYYEATGVIYKATNEVIRGT